MERQDSARARRRRLVDQGSDRLAFITGQARSLGPKPEEDAGEEADPQTPVGMESTREARRRRLVERGSDRLAFITGQTQSLPPKQEDEGEEAGGGGVDPQTTIAATFSEGRASSGFELTEQVPSKLTSVDVAGAPGELLPKSERGREVPETQFADRTTTHRIKDEIVVSEAGTNNGAAARATTSMARRQYDQDTRAVSSLLPEQANRIFSPNEISRSITASENIRLIAAVVTGLLAVLSNHPQRPLFLLMLTDAFIILYMLLSTKDTNPNNKAKAWSRGNDVGFTDNIGKALELGLLFQKAMGALFMDCSVCAVLMICGLAV